LIGFNPFKKDGVYITLVHKGIVFKLYFKDISSVAEFLKEFLSVKNKE